MERALVATGILPLSSRLASGAGRRGARRRWTWRGPAARRRACWVAALLPGGGAAAAPGLSNARRLWLLWQRREFPAAAWRRGAAELRRGFGGGLEG